MDIVRSKVIAKLGIFKYETLCIAIHVYALNVIDLI